MRARLIKEDINFERGRDPKGKMGVGYGPAKPQYIEDFEKAMEDFGIAVNKQTIRQWKDTILWDLVDNELPPSIQGKTVFLQTKPIQKSDSNNSSITGMGWSFMPMDSKSPRKWFDNPYPIIKYIIETHYNDIEGRIRALQSSLQDYIETEKKIQKWTKKWS